MAAILTACPVKFWSRYLSFGVIYWLTGDGNSDSEMKTLKKRRVLNQQHELWAPGSAAGTEASESATDKLNIFVETEDHVSQGGARKLRNLNDTLLPEGLLAVKLASELSTVVQLREQLAQKFPQNSEETRVRYARYVLRWFFPQGFDSLPRRVWMAYGEEAIEWDILRYFYLAAEPIMAATVADALFPLEEGMEVPSAYIDRFLLNHLGEQPTEKTRTRLKTNLMRLGFLARSRGHPDRVSPVAPTKTGFLILVHHLFAPETPRTLELRNILANPFWKYIGLKSEDGVRGVLRAIQAAGLVAKYVVADQLEQVTTCLTLDEILARRARL
jgi:hypothetical protein